MPERRHEGLRLQHIGVRARLDLRRRPVQLIHGGVVGRERLDPVAVRRDVFPGLLLQIQGLLSREYVADHRGASMPHSIETFLWHLPRHDVLELNARDHLNLYMSVRVCLEWERKRERAKADIYNR